MGFLRMGVRVQGLVEQCGGLVRFGAARTGDEGVDDLSTQVGTSFLGPEVIGVGGQAGAGHGGSGGGQGGLVLLGGFGQKVAYAPQVAGDQFGVEAVAVFVVHDDVRGVFVQVVSADGAGGADGVVEAAHGAVGCGLGPHVLDGGFQACAVGVVDGQVGEDFVGGASAGFDLVSVCGEGDALAEHRQGYSSRRWVFIPGCGCGAGSVVGSAAVIGACFVAFGVCLVLCCLA